LPDEAGVRLPTVTSLLGCSSSTAWRLAHRGSLKAVKVSSRVTVFNVGSIRALLSGG
jgi:predicted DNA-binding transcriptional regulator AlpA